MFMLMQRIRSERKRARKDRVLFIRLNIVGRYHEQTRVIMKAAIERSLELRNLAKQKPKL